MMKLLRITAQGIPLIKGEMDLVFYAQQRIAEEDKSELLHLFSNIYLNPTTGLIGINASGKTTILTCICLAADVLNNVPINHSDYKTVLGETEKATINMFFYTDDKTICRLETVIASYRNENRELQYRIVNERLWVKPEEAVGSRKTLTDFARFEPSLIRNNDEEYLPDDVSIIISYNRRIKDKLLVASLLQFTDMNILHFTGGVSRDIIEFLDPTIESLRIENVEQKEIIHLKFKGKDEIILYSFFDLNNYLSSGTIKGIITFTVAWGILNNGGLLIIDEIENHFNKEIVATLMHLFMDAEYNRNKGMIIFSTHYPELLDIYNRNDSIYITKNLGGITAENLTKTLKRNDYKKSEAYQSGVLEGTTPSYEAYMRLKKSFKATMV